MLDKMTYVNGEGKKVVMGEDNILIGSNDMRDFEWSYTTVYEVIASFTRSQSKKTLPLLFYGANCYKTANRVYEIFMYDVVNRTPGKLYIGDYYLEGYFFGSSKNAINKKNLYKTTYNFVTDTSVWIKEAIHKGRANGSGADFLDFPIDYNFDFYEAGTDYINNTSVAPCDFELTIYGNGQEEVSFIIGDFEYKVFTALAENELLTINTKDKTIIKTDVFGNKTNEFANRLKGVNIFNKLPSGANILTYDDFEWDITLYLERSEPEWT